MEKKGDWAMVQTVNGNQTRAQRPAAASIIILSVNLRPYAFNPFLVGADQKMAGADYKEKEWSLLKIIPD